MQYFCCCCCVVIYVLSIFASHFECLHWMGCESEQTSFFGSWFHLNWENWKWKKKPEHYRAIDDSIIDTDHCVSHKNLHRKRDPITIIWSKWLFGTIVLHSPNNYRPNDTEERRERESQQQKNEQVLWTCFFFQWCLFTQWYLLCALWMKPNKCAVEGRNSSKDCSFFSFSLSHSVARCLFGKRKWKRKKDKKKKISKKKEPKLSWTLPGQ